MRLLLQLRLTVLGGCLFCGTWTLPAWAAKKPTEPVTSQFANLPPMFDPDLFLPQGFTVKSDSSMKQMLFIASPFKEEKNLLVYTRYVDTSLPFTSIVKLVYHAPFKKDEAARFSEDVLAKDGIRILHREDKVFRGDGVILQVEHFAQNAWFLKWVAIYGNETQTNIIVAAFPFNRSEQLSDRLRRVVELASTSDRRL